MDTFCRIYPYILYNKIVTRNKKPLGGEKLCNLLTLFLTLSNLFLAGLSNQYEWLRETISMTKKTVDNSLTVFLV